VIVEQLVKYLLYGAMVAFLLRVAPLRRMFDELPRAQRRTLAAIFGLILFAQVVESKYDSYPFVKWGMYSSSDGEITYFEYEGILADGSSERFPLSRLLRIDQPLCPTCSKRLVWRFRDLGDDRYRAESDAERVEITERYERAMRAAWGVYAARHPEVDFEEVRVWRAHYFVADYVDASSIDRELVWSVPLGREVSDVE
jgi:hypothetical protein